MRTVGVALMRRLNMFERGMTERGPRPAEVPVHGRWCSAWAARGHGASRAAIRLRLCAMVGVRLRRM